MCPLSYISFKKMSDSTTSRYRSRRERENESETRESRSDRETERSRTRSERDTERSRTRRNRDTENSRSVIDGDSERSRTRIDRDSERSRTRSERDTERSRTRRERERERDRELDSERSRTRSERDSERSRIRSERDTERSRTRRDRERDSDIYSRTTSSLSRRSRSRLPNDGKEDGTDPKVEREIKRKIEELEERANELEEEIKKYKDLYTKEKESNYELEKTLLQKIADTKSNNDEKLSNIEQVSKQLKEASDELSNNQKLIVKKDTELYELKSKLEEATNTLTLSKNSLQKVDFVLRKAQETQFLYEKKLQNIEVSHDLTTTKLAQTEEELANYKTLLEEAREELVQKQKTFTTEIQALEKEIHEEASAREKLLRQKSDLEEENDILLSYFIPSTQVNDDAKPKRRTFTFDFVTERRKVIEEELEELRKNNLSQKMKHQRNIKEMQESLKENLAALPDDLREDLSFELEDLMKAMTMVGLKTKEKLFIFVTLVENQCDPGIVRELANLTLDMEEGDAHIMETPESLVTICLRESLLNTEDPKAFRNALLLSLARIRSRKTKKDIEYCKIVILEGGEYDD